jgi:hypothetical protein
VLRDRISKMIRECCDPRCLDEIPIIVTVGSGPFPESDLDELLVEVGSDEVEICRADPSALDIGNAQQVYSILVVVGRRDFSPDQLSDLIEAAGEWYELYFAPQEALLEAMLVHGSSGPFRIQDIELDPHEIVRSHPAFAWLEDRYRWSATVDSSITNLARSDKEISGSGSECDDEQESGGEEAEEEDESGGAQDDFPDEWDGEGLDDDEADDPGEEGRYHDDIEGWETKDEEEQEEERRWLEEGEEEEEEADDDDDGESDGGVGGPDEFEDDGEISLRDGEDSEAPAAPQFRSSQQFSVWSDRPQAEQDRFIAVFREVGMLKAFGYTVGAKASSDLTRRVRLRRALVEDLPAGLGASYIAECGSPNSLARLKKMADSIAAFARNAKGRRTASMEESIRHWEMDLEWMKQEWYRPGMGFDWPSTYVG